MKSNNIRVLVLFIGLMVLFIGGAYFAYSQLSATFSSSADIPLSNGMNDMGDMGDPAEQFIADSTDFSEFIDSENPEDSGNSEKSIAPDFIVANGDENEIKLSDKFGKPIVLNFWASWCPPCKEEMPVFNSIHEEMGDDITFMMVNLVDGQRETKETGTQYITEQGFTFPVYFDIKGEAGYTYNVSSIPTTVFIDKDGFIITGIRGSIDENTLRRGIDLIKQQ